MGEEKYNATERGVRDAWDFWLSQHDVSVPETIQAAVKDVMEKWLRYNADDLFTDAIQEAARRNMPDGEELDALGRLAAVRALYEGWSEQEDGPDAADFFVRLRPILGVEESE